MLSSCFSRRGPGSESMWRPTEGRRKPGRRSNLGVEALDARQLLSSFLGSLPATPQRDVSTIPSNGDVNPYGVAFVPAGFAHGGTLNTGDVLVANFNNNQNLQGTGTTITRITPGGSTSTFFQGNPGLGLDTGLAILKRGFVLVGNLPTADGTSATVQTGSILILDKNGHQIGTIANSKLLNGPWDMTVDDRGNQATVFVSNVLSGSVTRFNLTIPNKGNHVTVQSEVQIASGYMHRLDPASLVLGPAGLAYDKAHDTLYVNSSLDNEVFAIPHAEKIKKGQGTGTLVYRDNTHLHGPLGLVLAPNGDLIAANADGFNADPNQPSELVEFTKTGQFVTQLSINPQNAAPFGIAINTTQGSNTLAAVDDDANVVHLFSI
jgi:hypothetical protein